MSISGKELVESDNQYKKRLTYETAKAENEFSFIHGKLFGFEGYDYRQQKEVLCEAVADLADALVNANKVKKGNGRNLTPLSKASQLYFQLGYAEGIAAKNCNLEEAERKAILEDLYQKHERDKWFFNVLDSVFNGKANRNDLKNIYNMAVLENPHLFCEKKQTEVSPKLCGIRDAIRLLDAMEAKRLMSSTRIIQMCSLKSDKVNG